MSFKDFIITDRENRNSEKFEGTFLDYLEIVKQNPDVAKLSHKRLYDFIMSKGVEVLKFIRDFIKVLIEYGYVSLRQGTYSMLQLNEKSYKILKSDLKVVLKLEADNEEKVLNNMLFNKLKLWRRDVAIQEGVKPYIIFSDATLIELCNKLPQNEEELLEIRGMGEKKFKKYGEKLIELLKED